MERTGREYEFLYTEVPEGREAEALLHGQVAAYRTRTTRAGEMLYIEAYPVFPNAGTLRAARGRKTSKAQRRVNERRARRKMAIRVNHNFTARDLYLTLTYEGAVPDEATATRDIQNYIRRVKAWRKRRGLPAMKYIYTIEFDDGSGRRKRAHHHILMTGMDRDEAERLWTAGGRKDCQYLQPDENGLDGVAAYLVKARGANRKTQSSRNIEDPEPSVSDRKLSRRRVERAALRLPPVAKEVMEGLYPGYGFVDMEVRVSDYVPGAYVYAKMRRDGRGRT